MALCGGVGDQQPLDCLCRRRSGTWGSPHCLCSPTPNCLSDATPRLVQVAENAAEDELDAEDAEQKQAEDIQENAGDLAIEVETELGVPAESKAAMVAEAAAVEAMEDGLVGEEAKKAVQFAVEEELEAEEGAAEAKKPAPEVHHGALSQQEIVQEELSEEDKRHAEAMRRKQMEMVRLPQHTHTPVCCGMSVHCVL